MDPRKKLDVLEGSLESGVIDREEYSKSKEKLGPDLKEFDKMIEEKNKYDPGEEVTKKSSEYTLIISIVVILLVLIAIMGFGIFYKKQPKTLEELNILNLQGRLNPEQGYVYKGVYSFVNFDDAWFTQLKSPMGTKVYSMSLRYSPRDLKDIVIEGSLNADFFNKKSELFVTFNPKGMDFPSVGLAVADFDTHMSKVFEKKTIAACDRNDTEPCKTRPIVTCEDTDKLVLYVKESKMFRTYYNNNCIVVEGNGLDLVKGVDRVLYNLYNIMEQEET